jgi:hypothetical protein
MHFNEVAQHSTSLNGRWQIQAKQPLIRGIA